MSLRTLDESSFTDPQVLAMAQRVDIVNTGHDEPGMPHASITMTMRNGGQSHTFDQAFVEPQDDGRLQAKFSSCMQYAGKNLLETDALWAVLHQPEAAGLARLRSLMA